jgi:hypothetical protein
LLLGALGVDELDREFALFVEEGILGGLGAPVGGEDGRVAAPCVQGDPHQGHLLPLQVHRIQEVARGGGYVQGLILDRLGLGRRARPAREGDDARAHQEVAQGP